MTKCENCKFFFPRTGENFGECSHEKFVETDLEFEVGDEMFVPVTPKHDAVLVGRQFGCIHGEKDETDDVS